MAATTFWMGVIPQSGGSILKTKRWGVGLIPWKMPFPQRYPSINFRNLQLRKWAVKQVLKDLCDFTLPISFQKGKSLLGLGGWEIGAAARYSPL